LAIVGPLMLAAAFEWILWLAAFLYCLIKVYLKADHWTIRALAAAMVVLFTVFRYAYLDQYEFRLLKAMRWLTI
jgi:chitin synthase